MPLASCKSTRLFLWSGGLLFLAGLAYATALWSITNTVRRVDSWTTGRVLVTDADVESMNSSTLWWGALWFAAFGAFIGALFFLVIGLIRFWHESAAATRARRDD